MTPIHIGRHYVELWSWRRLENSCREALHCDRQTLELPSSQVFDTRARKLPRKSIPEIWLDFFLVCHANLGSVSSGRPTRFGRRQERWQSSIPSQWPACTWL